MAHHRQPLSANMPLAIGGFGSGIGGDDATDSDTASESQSGKLTIPDSLVKALADFARILAFEERICGVYEAHERVIELLEAGAPLFPESEYSLASMAYALEECEAQGLKVGAKKEVHAVTACAKRIHGFNPEGPDARAMVHFGLGMVCYEGFDRPEDLPEARRLFGLAASRGNAEVSPMLLTLADL